MKNKNQNQDLKNEYNFGELKFESPVNFENKSLEEIKQLADDTFRESKIKRRLLRAGIGILTVGAATMAPLAVYQFIIPVKVSMKSTNQNIKGYEVKLQRGSRVSEIKIVEIEGYDFIGFFKDKNCTIKYTGTEELNKNSVIYTSYKLKEYTVTIPTSDKYLLTTSGIVYHGEDFTFSVYPQEGYDLTNMVVKVGEKTLTPLEGVYTISNVTSDLEVSITGIEKIKYAITLTESDNCSVNIPSYIEHDEDLMFSVTPDTGYNAAHVNVKVNGVEVTPNSSGIYVVKNVKKLLSISVTGIEKNIYNVTTSGDKEHYTVNTVSSVEYGDDLKFTITPNVGYSLDDILVKVNGEIVIPVNGVYTVEHVEEDVDIKVISEFNVSVIGDQNYTVNVVDSINYFEDLIFNITPKTGYTLDDIIVKANGEVLTSIGGFYTIEDITEDVVIEVFGKYTVNTTGDVNYTVDVVNSIYYGEDLTFTITPKAGYTLNNILVKVNGQEVTGNQGSYTIENITEDITIEVLGAYQINVNGDENCDVDIVNIIHYDEKLTFTITPKEGYKLDYLTVKVNNQPITSDGGIYTVENVTENITIDISGVEIIVCSVYVTGDEHCIVDVVDSINYGENLTFEIYAKNDCSIEDIEVKVNGQRIIPVGGIYTVENVKTDISILITGGAYVHTVSVVGNENCTVHVVQKILSGQDLNFHVTPKTGYTLEEMKVTVNNVVVEADEDDFYTFKDVSEDVTIVITGVKLITYTVSVDCDENYTVNIVDKVNYGQNLTFTIEPDTGYSLDSLNVTVNGDKITAVNGVYTVTNVTRNVNIVISGAELITHTVSVSAGSYNTNVDVLPNTSLSDVSALTDIINFMDYNTNGVLYTDQACTQVADLTTTVTADTTLYSKPATLDKLKFTWDSSTSSYRVEECSTDISGEVVIPNKYKDSTNDGYVTTIAYLAFDDCTDITSIEIPSSVLEIGYYFTFGGCSSLTSITVAEGNEKYHSKNNCIIETDTNTLIKGCKTSIIPNYVTTIGHNAFGDCTSLTEIEIPASVTTIGNSAFWGCDSLTEIEIPASVTTIGYDAFYDCSGLRSVNFAENGNLVKVEESAFAGCSNLNEIEVPASITSLLDFRVFKRIDGLQKVTFAENSPITTINQTIFNDCTQLIEIILPSNLTTIENNAFSGCSGLTTIEIPASVTTIDSDTFKGCSGLLSINIPAGVTRIWDDAFEGCTGLTSITVAQGNQTYYSENNCIIETATKILILGCKTSQIPNNVTYIGNDAFKGCIGLTSIEIPASVTTIGYDCFADCINLKEVSFEENMNSRVTIYDSAFKNCISLTNITSNRICHIESSAFEGCTSLISVEIDEETIIIEEKAFYGCTNLTSVTLLKTNGSLGAHRKVIGKSAFEGCVNLSNIKIPKNIKEIHENAFYGCTGLTSVTFYNNLTTIKSGAFSGCTSLTEIEIPLSVTEIGANAFASCSGLTTINFKNTIGWQKNTGTTETPVWVNVEASDLFDLVKAGTELRCEII